MEGDVEPICRIDTGNLGKAPAADVASQPLSLSASIRFLSRTMDSVKRNIRIGELSLYDSQIRSHGEVFDLSN